MQAPGRGMLARLEVNFADIFLSLFLVRILQFAPSGLSCNVQCFWLGPNSEFLTNWMNEFQVDQNNHLSLVSTVRGKKYPK